MDMSYYKDKYEPINGKWYIKELLGEGSYGKVFCVEYTDALKKKTEAALKVITIPKSEDEIMTMRQLLASNNSVSNYFNNMASKIAEELDLMAQLKGHTNIVSYEEHDIFPHANGIGYDILIRMEKLTPLTKIADNLSEQDVIKIGIDICKALEVCQKYNIVHRDIKPENIFISPSGDYKLGDFGVAKTIQHNMTMMTTAGTYTYMAPELKKGEECRSNVDIYSLGLVMYKLLNYNRDPFLPLPPNDFTFEDREQALISRLSGMPLMKPANAGNDLAMIILQACAYDPNARYQTPSQMRKALESLYDGSSGSFMVADTYEDSSETVIDKAKSTVSMAIKNKKLTILIACFLAVVMVGVWLSGSSSTKPNNTAPTVKTKDSRLTDITGISQDILLSVGASARIEFEPVPINAIYTDVSYSSDNSDIIDVKKDGTIVAKKTGSSVVTINVDGITKSVTVNVICSDDGHKYSPNIVEKEHPHNVYKKCDICGHKKDVDLVIVTTECEICSEECNHNFGVVSYEGSHPHREYRICKKCKGTMYLETNHFIDDCNLCSDRCSHNFGVASHEEQHPHKEYRICKLCGETMDLGTYHYVDECKECNE